MMASATMARPSLTSNDTAVLQALFDAESSPSSGVTIDPRLPSWPATVLISHDDLGTLKTLEVEIVRELQPDKNPSVESVQDAVHKLDSIVQRYPSYPSAYTNRAQTLRMLVDLQSNEISNTNANEGSLDTLFTPEATDLVTRIFNDLSQAIDLVKPISPVNPVSPVQARLLADAYTHRGYIVLKAARIKKNHNNGDSEIDNLNVGPQRLWGFEADQLEEMASRDFFLGGQYGNKVAQQLAVQTNPYAKMCGAIVKEALRKEMTGS
ncbi:uncharacterized protein N7483_008219 [Penicillium malachiteum]|uniref:uncharacterized protein n=1 Tax=Penicillium malachiteum TaxID=1324776 RepID=UPI0025485A8B|nr:uncharacterized protein N7483_008219 [Penicillium malachiteum]KAJ5720285.1 hypothetical protein N7483_008219 [Penicillium malachiteum]